MAEINPIGDFRHLKCNYVSLYSENDISKCKNFCRLCDLEFQGRFIQQVPKNHPLADFRLFFYS